MKCAKEMAVQWKIWNEIRIREEERGRVHGGEDMMNEGTETKMENGARH